jgi:hypothetical protein
MKQRLSTGEKLKEAKRIMKGFAYGSAAWKMEHEYPYLFRDMLALINRIK